MIGMNEAQSGKRRAEDVGNPRNFPHTKSYNKFFGTMIGYDLIGIFAGIQLINTVVDFWKPAEPREFK